jgi:hypothetical protein
MPIGHYELHPVECLILTKWYFEFVTNNFHFPYCVSLDKLSSNPLIELFRHVVYGKKPGRKSSAEATAEDVPVPPAADK